MDPGGVGALIGIGAMICIAGSFFIRDKCQKKKEVLSSTTPLFISSETKKQQELSYLDRRNHYKMSMLFKKQGTLVRVQGSRTIVLS